MYPCPECGFENEESFNPVTYVIVGITCKSCGKVYSVKVGKGIDLLSIAKKINTMEDQLRNIEQGMDEISIRLAKLLEIPQNKR